MFCKSRHDRELLFHPDVDNHVFEERFSMTSNAPNDPILRKTEPNHNPVKKRRLGKAVIGAMIIFGVVVFFIYATMIGFSVSGA